MPLAALRTVVTLVAALVLALPAAVAHATPASDVVTSLNSSIIRIMQNAKTLGYKGRYKRSEEHRLNSSHT